MSRPSTLLCLPSPLAPHSSLSFFPSHLSLSLPSSLPLSLFPLRVPRCPPSRSSSGPADADTQRFCLSVFSTTGGPRVHGSRRVQGGRGPVIADSFTSVPYLLERPRDVVLSGRPQTCVPDSPRRRSKWRTVTGHRPSPLSRLDSLPPGSCGDRSTPV